MAALERDGLHPFVTAQLSAKPDAVFSVVCCGNFDSFAKQAKPLGYFDALRGQFIGVGEAGSVETLRSLGDEYPLGVWGNTYDASNWRPADPVVCAAHDAFFTRLSAAVGPEVAKSSWAIQGYIGMQFLVEAIRKAGTTDPAQVSKALQGMAIDSPQGPITMRAKDHQATRGELYGVSIRPPGSPYPVLDPIRAIDPTPFMD